MTLAQKLISQGINNFVAKTNAKENLDESTRAKDAAKITINVEI